MNSLEKQMVNLLKELKNKYAVSEVKMEFEAEATRMNEAMRLKDIASQAGVGLIVKIGGTEAITDLFDAQLLGATGVVAPMIESQYSMKKYIESIKKYIPEEVRNFTKFGLNLETYLAYQNLDAILNTPGFETISTLTFGRVDFVGSMNLTRSQVNSEIILRIAEDIYKKARKKGVKTTLGGAISTDTLPFIESLVKQKLLDRFETRKVVFETTNNMLQKAKEGILKAVEFELLWLKNKKNYYTAISHEDDARIDMIEKRQVKK